MSNKKAAVQLPDITGNVTESSDKVERIREILFGAQMRDYAQKFDFVNRELARMGREIERLSQQLREQETAAKRQLREETERLTATMQEQDQRHILQVQELDKRQTGELEELEQKHAQRLQDLDHIMHNGDRDLLNKLRELSEQLNDLKVDRSTLGELLMDLGASLKANAPAPITEDVDVLDQLGIELT